MSRARENKVQMELAKHILQWHPNRMFHSDLTGKDYNTAVAGRILKNRRGYPDFFIIEPRCFISLFEPNKKRIYQGMYLELKEEDTKLLDKTEQFYKDKHLEEQGAYLWDLIDRGYFCSFAIGLEHAIKLIDMYLYNDYDVFKQILLPPRNFVAKEVKKKIKLNTDYDPELGF